jgi:hypothetical protein
LLHTTVMVSLPFHYRMHSGYSGRFRVNQQSHDRLCWLTLCGPPSQLTFFL